MPEALRLGLIYCLAVAGFATSLRMLAYADLTVEGSFALGGVVSAVILRNGASAHWTLFAALLAGGVAGLFTASLHCFFRVGKLLSGIITLAVLYTVNLRVQGSGNESMFGTTTVFDLIPSGLPKLSLILPAAFLGLGFLYWLLNTEFGLFLRACGENENVVRKAGYDRRVFILVGLCISNAFICMSGALFSQYAGFSDVGMGGGLIVICLTSLILGEIIVRPTSVATFLLAVLLGAFLCQAVSTACLSFDLHPSDYKGVVGLILVALIYIRQRLAKRGMRRTIGADVF